MQIRLFIVFIVFIFILSFYVLYNAKLHQTIMYIYFINYCNCAKIKGTLYTIMMNNLVCCVSLLYHLGPNLLVSVFQIWLVNFGFFVVDPLGQPCLIFWVVCIWFNVPFNTFRVISGRCLIVTEGMITTL